MVPGPLAGRLAQTDTCDDGSTLTIELDAAIAAPHGGTAGGWRIIDGTGDYEGATGGGFIVGEFYEGGIVDEYRGVIVS